MISHELGLIVPEIPKCGSSAMYAYLLSKDDTLSRKGHFPDIEDRKYINQFIAIQNNHYICSQKKKPHIVQTSRGPCNS